jgi:retron-type reverse transcriptase
MHHLPPVKHRSALPQWLPLPAGEANGGAAGVDVQSLERFAAPAELYLSELATALREGRYRPQPVRRVDIPKGDGKTRPLGIPMWAA